MTTAMTTATESLLVAFPTGSTVSVAVEDHRLTRSGTYATRILVLASLDGAVVNVSGWVATVLSEYRVTPVLHHGTRVIVQGHEAPYRAAYALVEALAAHLHGSTDALRSYPL
jgi:hypothetical protein